MDRRPCLIVAYSESAFASRWGRHFRRNGWAVHSTPSAAELDRLADQFEPTAIVVDCEIADEVDKRLAAHLSRRFPGVEIVLLAARGRTHAKPSEPVWFSRQATPDLVLEHLQSRRLVNA